jgi:gliding motility-associated-like protein
MRSFYLKIAVFSILILRGVVLIAQPANDGCETAISIANPRQYCSRDAEFTNVGATTSTVASISNCISANGADVWFSFRALATDVRIIIQGATAEGAKGTMRRPEAAIYAATDCSDLSEIACLADAAGRNIIEVYKGGLIVGERYYIRIQSGAGARAGTFAMCVYNYNPPANITSDCPTSSILCDKSPFAVASVTGAGTDRKEMDDATCFISSGGGQTTNLESNSTWFKWTCLQAGTLTFTITPNKLDDDIDFALYELPNGLNNCTGKKLVRCMATGTTPSVCAILGATGLRDGETDISEESGCRPSARQTNFVKPLDMEVGKSYALAINNFTSTGNGFTLNFGGSGTFQGPEAKITVNKPDKKYCLGEDVIFTDASSFVGGNITKRLWKFGKDASVDSTTSNGPHRVYYKTPGWKSVLLTVTSDRGCVVTSVLDSIFVEKFKFDSVIRRPTCQLGTDGMIRLRVVSCGRAPIRYNWENTGYTTRDSITGLSSGRYKVAVTDSSGKYVDTVFFTLRQFEIELDTAKKTVTAPLCFGDKNGKIVVKPATGIAPFQYKWNTSTVFTPDSSLTNIGEGQYSVEIRDANNCKGFYNFDVVAPQKVKADIDTINISCFGKTDGSAIAYPSGGVGKYSVSWSRGDLGDTIRNLKAGNYIVFIRDANNCEITKNVRISEPTEISLRPIRIQGAKCYGDSTAALVIQGLGGTPPYRYSVDGIRFQRDTAFINIPAKKYSVVVRDSTGCRNTVEVDVPQPPQLQVSAGPDLEVDLGFPIDLRAVVVPSSKQVAYAWTPADSTVICKTCARTAATPLTPKLYRITVKDSLGCRAYDEVYINVIKKRPIYFPTAFSPNADGVNDFFTGFGNQAAIGIKEMKVFNRWGDLVFEANNIALNNESKGWDGYFKGKLLDPDVFTFYAVINFIDNEELVYKGDITLIR